eukprot:3761333-Amphidinium_carterae.1
MRGKVHALTPITNIWVCRSSSQQSTEGYHEILRLLFGCFLHCSGPSIVVMIETKKAMMMVPRAHSKMYQCVSGRPPLCCTTVESTCVRITRHKATYTAATRKP